MNNYDALKLENQLCFPLYACARDVIRKYTPFLDEIGLTYTQYVTMLVLWEREEIVAKELCDILRLDSGTLTPVLKSLEGKGLITRSRSAKDERFLVIKLTDDGASLRDRAADIPGKLAGCMNISEDEAVMLYKILYKMLDGANN